MYAMHKRELMESLSSDLVLIILRKLALQDPSSHLQVTSACSYLNQTAEKNPDVWKEAFFGRADIGLCEHSKDERIETHINSSGGYKPLRVEARWGNVLVWTLNKHKNAESLPRTMSLKESAEIYEFLQGSTQTDCLSEGYYNWTCNLDLKGAWYMEQFSGSLYKVTS